MKLVKEIHPKLVGVQDLTVTLTKPKSQLKEEANADLDIVCAAGSLQ